LFNLKGKSFIVTGAASGIGRAIALVLGEAQASVAVADYDPRGAADTATMLNKSGANAQAIKADVRDEKDVKAMVDRAMATYERLDGAANVAGISTRSLKLCELSLADWRNCIAVNLTGAFLCLKYQIPAMLKTGGGSIVVVSSTAATQGGCVRKRNTHVVLAMDIDLAYVLREIWHASLTKVFAKQACCPATACRQI
jgi:NAD(P)-dependent dehydrogenase (short-subunit alcohol dehydrogenase family)